MKKEVVKEVYLETSGARMVLNTGLLIGLFALGGMAFEAGKKALATATLVGLGGVLIGQVIDGAIMEVHHMKKYKRN